MPFSFIYRQGQNIFNRSIISLSELSINSWVIWQQSYYRTGYIATNEMERWSWIYSKNLEGNGRGWFGVYMLEFFKTTCGKVGQKLIFRQSTSPNRNSRVGRYSRPPSIIKVSEWNQGNHDGLILNLYEEIINNNKIFMVKLLKDYIKN